MSDVDKLLAELLSDEDSEELNDVLRCEQQSSGNLESLGSVIVQSPALATQESLLGGDVVSVSQQTRKSSNQPAAAAAVSGNLSEPGRADHQLLAHASDNMPLLEAVLLDTHSSLPTSGEKTLSVDNSHMLHTSLPHVEQSGFGQAAEEVAAGAAEVQGLGIYHQPATKSLPKPANTFDMPETSTAGASCTSATLQDSLDALSADEDDFADNVELSSAGILRGHLPQGRAPDDVSSLLTPDLQSLQEPSHASQNQQQQVLQQQANAQIISQAAAFDIASTQLTDSAAQQDSTAKEHGHTTHHQASLAASVSEQVTHSQHTTAAAASYEDPQAIGQQPQPTDKVTEQEQKQDEQHNGAVGVLPPHEAAMAKAEEAERRLLTDKSLAASQAEEHPAEALMSRLQWGAADWPQEGRPDSKGGLLGGEVMLRLDLMSAFQEYVALGGSLGSNRAVAAFRGVVAVGTSSGVVGVLMPRGLSADGHPSGQARVVQLGEARPKDNAVSSMAFSLQGNILLAGHANGEVNLWEFKRTGWEVVKAIKDAHASAVTSATFVEGSAQLALTADAKGRLVSHNVTAYLSITSIFAGRLSRSSQPVMLLDGKQLGPVCCVLPLLPPRPSTHTDASDPARTHPAQENGAVYEGLFLAATLGGMLVARVTPDGRFNVLHNLARPPDAREGCLPYPTWRLCTPTKFSSPTKQLPSATLVLAWEKKIYLMDVPLAGLPAMAAGEAQAAAPRGLSAPPPARVLRSWESEHTVVGVSWLNDQALAVVSEQGPRSHVHLYDASGSGVRERLVFEDSLVGSQHIVNMSGIPEQACHVSVAFTPDRLILLASQGVRSARLLSWQERLAALRELLLWDHALWLGLRIYMAAQPHDIKAGTQTAPLTVWREEGKGADPAAVAAALVALLLAYLDLALPEPSEAYLEDHAGDEEDMQAAGAADTAIQLCILIKRAEVLWEGIYPRYLARKQQGILLERLLPHILASKLPSFPPEVMQALVEHFSGHGQPEAVERAVLHMDIASLDLNQVLRLCWRYGLLTALTYILNRGLNDYMGPAAHLLMALLRPSAHGPGRDSKAAGYRLLVYLRCCLTGCSFPPGSGGLPEAMIPEVKAQLLAFLIYTSPPMLQQQLQGVGQGSGQPEDASEEVQKEHDLAQMLPGPCPVLRRLVAFDPGAVLAVLQQSLGGWDALETDLLESANLTHQAAELSSRVRSATQVVVDAVLDLLDAGVFRQSDVNGTDSTAEALLFVRGLLVEGRATAEPQATVKVLRHLAQDPHPASEDSFVAVLQTAELQGSDMEQALQLAQEAGFQQAVVRVHYLAGNFLQALHCTIGSAPPPGAAFKYIRDVLDEAHMPEDRLSAFRGAVMESIGKLAKSEPHEAAALVLERFPEEHTGVVESLKNQPELQYKYLQAATQVAKANMAVENEVRGSPHGLGVSSGVHDQLLAEPAMCEQFVGLLCQFEPTAVLPFLQSHDSYRVEACLPSCQRYEVNDAHAYLLERLGDVAAAIKLYVRDIQRCNSALIQGVLQGDVLLPNVTSTSGRMKGYAGSASLFSYSSGHTLLERHASTPTAASDPSRPPQAPLLAAHQALKAAVALCQRHSLEASQDMAQQLWFEVLQCYVQQLRQIRQDAQQVGEAPSLSEPHKSGGADWSLLSPCGSSSQVTPSLALHLTRAHSAHNPPVMATTEVERLAAIQQVFTGFMEEVISGMAGYIPLKAIGQRILAQYSRQQFGDFRGTLLGLLSAYNYESSILTTASRLMGSDAFRSLFALYQSRTRVAMHVVTHKDGDTAYTGDAEVASAAAFAAISFAGAHAQGAGSGSQGGTKLSLDLTPASERSKASLVDLGKELHTNAIANRQPESPAYKGGIDLNFLRTHNL
ncbi:hypothetical protein WJX77_004866 [Trebouxia sp. C0004]